MLRGAIYARFSTELQRQRSIDDQIALCRAHAERQGITVVATYHDSAKSGASMFGRDGLFRIMEAARAKEFEIVIVEALDRLARDMEDLAGIHKRLTFLGVEIRAVHDGTADSILVGIRGLVGQMQREDGAKKVRRGMAGVLRDGRHPGGRAYGYRPVPGRKGQLEIIDAEAAVVRRIFGSYADGATPREIAAALNREGVAPPRGTRWNASTINGNATRGHGIIINDLYAGRITWNKVRMLKNPDTGRRISRPNPREEWQSIEAPHLRIVDPETFDRAQSRKAASAGVPGHQMRRPKHLLSGLLRCGSCGAGMSAQGNDRHGRRRVRCSAMVESGTCTNSRSVYLDRIEAAVLSGMREQLRDPRMIECYVRRYNAQREKLARVAGATRASLESRLAGNDRDRERVVDLVIRGVLEEREARTRLDAIKAKRQDLEAELVAIGNAPTVIALHPATLERYVATVDRLAAKLAHHAGTKEHTAVVDDFRALVKTVTIHPKGPRQGFEVEVKGRLAALIGGAAFPSTVGVPMVAEAGLEPATYGL